MMKKYFLLLVLAFSVALAAGNPKYIFLFIGDGMALPQRMTAEEFSVKNNMGKLLINHMEYSGEARTSSANQVVTDSAAAGTALACGEKTNNCRIGMSADGKRKLESVAALAKKKGKKVGILSSVTINHATPASFYGHRLTRGQYYELGLDLIDSNFDYFGGGGFSGNLNDRRIKRMQKEGKKVPAYYKGDLLELVKKAGYTVAVGKEGLAELKPGAGKVFACGHPEATLGYVLDKRKGIPTLADYTRKGIELLDNPNGFFMMVEGGAVDWRGHANDAAGNMHEVIALDKAVAVAFEFAAKHPGETLIVVTGDHETGGMTRGFAGSGHKIDVDVLGRQTRTVDHFNYQMKALRKKKKDLTFEDTKELLTKCFGFEFSGSGKMSINEKELETLQKGFNAKKLGNAARQVISAKAGISWSTGGHTALPVLTTASGCKAELFKGSYENSDISLKLKSLL